MPETAPTATTLGQRIDALLAPLYAEADQHRATLADAESQMASLQQRVEAANHGLAQIEGRMAEVVRSLAGDDPVIAAIIGAGHGPATPATTPATPDPTPTTFDTAVDVAAQNDASPQGDAEPDADAEPAPEPQAAAATISEPAPTAVAEADASPASDSGGPAAQAPANEPAQPAPEPPAPAGSEQASDPPTTDLTPSTVPLDLDPEHDQAMVDEAASLLDAEPGSEPPPDIAAAAERAVAAAKELRAKSEPAA